MSNVSMRAVPELPERQNAYSYDELLRCASGGLFGVHNSKLPQPPMLMTDRITRINGDGGVYGKGEIRAELDINPDLWFFNCHFTGDPVMPGCLGLDALWQLIGFHLVWSGFEGRGRALGCGKAKFTGQVLPTSTLVSYQLDIKRVIDRKLIMGIADGTMSVDGRVIYTSNDLRVGLFTSANSL